VDSSFFIALVLKSDQWHDRAVQLIPKLEESQKMVSGLIISEAVTMVGSRSGGKAGKMVYDYITDNCRVFNQEGSIYDEAINTYLKYDGTLSLTDSVTLEVMSIFNIKEIVSFDSDFDKVNGLVRIH
jgi:predicted nucleic acid-binding protein